MPSSGSELTCGEGGRLEDVGECGWLLGWLRDKWLLATDAGCELLVPKSSSEAAAAEAEAAGAAEVGALTLPALLVRRNVCPSGWSISALIPQPYVKDDSAWK